MHLVKGTSIVAVALAGTLVAGGLMFVGDGPPVASAAPPAEQAPARTADDLTSAAGRVIGTHGGCDSWGCGANSAQIHGTPIGELHLGGIPNTLGFYIEPKLYKDVRGQIVPNEFQLDIEQGAFVGKHLQTGRIVLRGKRLIGSWFVLRRPKQPLSLRILESKILIKDVATVPLFVQRPTNGSVSNRAIVEYAFAYQLELSGAPGEMRYLCRSDSASGSDDKFHAKSGRNNFSAIGWGLGVNHTAPSPVVMGDGYPYRVLPWLGSPDTTTYAVLVKGEVYDASTASVRLHGDQANLWFNIACAGTALAKMKLMGYDPEDSRTAPDQRQATLRMITARYCGDKSYTRDHVPLVWQNASDWFQPETTFDVASIGEIEASWGKDGAICLNEPRERAWSRKAVIKECGDIRTCDAAGNPQQSETPTLPPFIAHPLPRPQVNNPAALLSSNPADSHSSNLANLRPSNLAALRSSNAAVLPRIDPKTLRPLDLAIRLYAYLHQVPAGAEWVTRHRQPVP
jgi:hypothetical protein